MATASKNKYTVTIGIECHVQLKTKTKLFAAVGNDARNAKPNTLISHICLGMPGALPVLNEKAVEYAMRAAFAFQTRPQTVSYFERKHYFYPDLPKGYQITQLEKPIIKGGSVDITVGGQSRQIRLNRVQMEEDAGKNIHPTGKDYSLVDLNRAGTPLLEIVSEPDLHSAEEAKAYVRELYLLMRYVDVSDADLYQGNMRFDVNVSLSPDPNTLGTRTETKNLNSFRSVEKAVEYEIKRQTALLDKGEAIVQETRGWDDAKQKTVSQRGKEEAHDYRYFPEPDIPPIVLTDAQIDAVAADMPSLPSHYRQLFQELKIDPAAIEALILDIQNGRFIESILANAGADHARRVALWIVNAAQTNEDETAESTEWRLSQANAVKLSVLVAENKLSSTAAKELWAEIWKNDADPEKLAEERNLLQVSDEGEIIAIVDKVLAENEKAANDVKNGEMKAIGFLVGQVMKASQGKANPGMAQELIKKQLGL